MKYFPIYLLEIAITFITGAMSSAISNHLILGLNYPPSIAGIITSMFFIGFFTATLLIGNISDKIKIQNVLKIIFTAKIFLNAFYLFPIQSNVHLWIFGTVYCLDGAFNGIFWPTIQNYSIMIERRSGEEEKKKFTKGYHLSWNVGFILGKLGGTIMVYLTSSNYLVFYLGIFGAVIGCLNTWLLIDKTLKRNKTEEENQENITVAIDESANTSIDNANISNLRKIAFYSIIFMLLTHSLTDGAIVILLPLKTESLFIDDYWVFLLSMIKLLSQTWSTTHFSGITSKKIIIYNIIAESVLILVWQSFMFSNHLILVIMLLILSGFAQGAIYALNMNLTAMKAADSKSSKPFAFFQASMSGGRTLGPLIIGFTAAISFNVGVMILFIYEIFALLVFIYKNA